MYSSPSPSVIYIMYGFFLCLTVGALVGISALPSVAFASTSTGWYSARTEYMGSAPGCASGEVRMDVALKEYDSFAGITPSGVRIKLEVWDSANGTVAWETNWSTGTGISPAVCYDIATEGVKPVIEVIDSSSPYLAQEKALTINSPSDTIEEGNYYRANVHLMRTSDSDGYTVEGTGPNNQIFNADPSYSMRVGALPEQYDSLANSSMDGLFGVMLLLKRDDIGGPTTQYGAMTSSGAYSSHSFGPRGLSDDGYYAWTTFYVLDNEITFTIAPSVTQTKSQSITSGMAYPYLNFLLDRAAPQTSMTVTPGEEESDGQPVTITTTVQDELSGLEETVLYINGSPVDDYQFPVGVGTTGGPKNTNEVTFEVVLPPGDTYTIYTRTEDAAGNISQSNTVTHTVPEPDPDPEPDEWPDLVIEDGPGVGSYTGVDTETGIYDEVTFAFTIGNNGDESTGEQSATVPWQLEIHDVERGTTETQSGTVPSIDAADGPDDTRAVVVTETEVPYGVYELTAHVDPGNSIEEIDDTNNTRGPVEVAVLPADPELSLQFANNPVRHGDQAEILWSRIAAYPMECAVHGPAMLEDEDDPDSVTSTIVLDATESSGSISTAARHNAARYTFACTEPITEAIDPDAASYDVDAILEVIPRPYEL